MSSVMVSGRNKGYSRSGTEGFGKVSSIVVLHGKAPATVKKSMLEHLVDEEGGWPLSQTYRPSQPSLSKLLYICVFE